MGRWEPRVQRAPSFLIALILLGCSMIVASFAVGELTRVTVAVVSADAPAFQSDDFNGASLNGSVWQFVNPVGDATLSLNGTNAMISVPAGSNHDVWTGGNRAPRLMQAANNTDFEIEVKFETQPQGTYAMQGVLVEADSSNFLRFDFHREYSNLKIFVASFTAGSPTVWVNRVVADGVPLYMRVKRVGSEWTHSYSYDGVNWIAGGSFSRTLVVTSVGVFVGNAGPSPAYTGSIDYFFNTAAPIFPEDGGGTPSTSTTTSTPTPDSSPPVVSYPQYVVGSTSLQVSWTTDDLATGSIEYGTSIGYELGSVAQPNQAYSHSVNISGLQPTTVYHFRVVATNSAGRTGYSKDFLFRTQAPSSLTPVFDIWYGQQQYFGQLGNPQRWVNILGRVLDPDGIASLIYSLNGGPPSPLSIGPDTRRLLSRGDFNVEIDKSRLMNGTNTVTITATDTLNNQSSQQVTVQYTGGRTWPLPYSTNWSAASSINDVAQVVDGLWFLDGGSVRPVELGYDRIIAVGDVSWTDYEIEVPITIHGFDPAGFNPPSNSPGLGILARWQGHYDWDGRQPTHGWRPAGGTAWYGWSSSLGYRLTLLDGWFNPKAEDTSGRTLEYGVRYIFKMRVVSRPGQTSMYYVKVWEDSQPEPASWDLSAPGTLGELSEGSALLVAHHVDVTVGSIKIVPILPPTTPTSTPTPTPTSTSTPSPTTTPGPPSTIQSDDFNSLDLNTSLWQFVNPVGDATLSLNGTNAMISVPGGSNHDVWTGGNRAPRLMQAANNTDFEIEVKFETQPQVTYAIQGVLVEADSQNFLRFDFEREFSNLKVFVASFSAGSPTVWVNKVITDGVPLYVRVKRVGSEWTHSYSYDGVNWIVGGSFSRTLAVTSVGVFVGNAGPSPAYTGSIDYFFNTAAPIVPEDGNYSMPTSTSTPTASLTATSTPASTTTEAITSTPTSTSTPSPTTTPGPPSTIQSDDFNSLDLNTSLWQFVNPVGDATLSLNGTNAMISVPGGSNHDVWTGGNRAPRLMQAANNTDFEIEVKFETQPQVTYAIQGVLVEADSQNFLRFDFEREFSNLKVFVASFSAGSPTVWVDTVITDGVPLYMRVKRLGSLWTHYHSYDGVNWIVGGSFSRTLPVTSVGVFVGNAGPSPAYTGSIDYFFNTAAPIVPENGGGTPSTSTTTSTSTPTASLTSTDTPTSTATETVTPTPTETYTPTPTDTNTPTSTSTVTPTATDTATASPTDTLTATPTSTDTATPTPTETPTVTPTETQTAAPTSTDTATPTATETHTPTSTATATLTATDTATTTVTGTPTITETPTPIGPSSWTWFDLQPYMLVANRANSSVTSKWAAYDSLLVRTGVRATESSFSQPTVEGQWHGFPQLDTEGASAQVCRYNKTRDG